ncbi:serine phosphatase RsbU (regulator of sigma subunit) [Geodermatophilus tzadiensis]|uniref:Serine phosphatase RsbU (Regulator of sigma subunit) n=1 Tax=Geodermatophilus tzadiensis TaxID=1137988 RepID=A0A2T0TPB8_9ACTN|nr:SpoIIE family protein phosphatase [Geodermatophilus tzadiensis]PRY47487.1 serine phosphatase RsbU (regulator of sigma subunit) [Geodermatophilus tzadiensis]
MQESELPVEAGVGSDRVRSAALHQLPWYAIVYEGPEHRVVALNAEFLRVLGGFDPIGMRAADFLVGIAGQGVIEIFDRAYAGERAMLDRIRLAVVTPHGHEEEIVLDFEVGPFRDRHGEVVGVLGVGRDITAAVRREEADTAAAAELSRRYRRATDVIDEVQRALLPGRLPVLPALDVAAGYAIGGAEQAAGGDWFDVLSLDDRTVAAVVGDVVGHGVDASAVMAQLRAVALERLHAGAEVAEVVAALDRFVQVVPGGSGSTVCVLTVDLPSGALRYCLAGHPPPLLAGGTGYLEPSGEGPLGEAGDRRALTGRLDDGVLLLYSDGIVERPGVPATRGVVELLRTATAAVADELLPAFSLPAAVDRATVQVLERLTRETGATDDVTLLALQRVPVLEPFRLERVVGPGDVAGVRASLRAWFRPGQVDERALSELDQILTELVENAVEHAYGGRGGPVTVSADLAPSGDLTLTVSDRGPWRPPARSVQGLGIGLALVRQLSAAVSIHHEHGTEVTVHHRPWKPSRNSVPRPPATPPGLADVYLEEHGDGNVLRVRGPIDAAMLQELESHLALGTIPGAPDLAIDLDDVTVLSSTAISALRLGLQHAGQAGVSARVRCRPGSVAQQVLTLAGIPTATDTGH